MSYDISLYDRSFLLRTSDGEFNETDRPPNLAVGVIEAVKEELRDRQYLLESVNAVCEEYVHPHLEWGLQVVVQRSCIWLSVPYWTDCDNAIAVATDLAHLLAEQHDLQIYDSQIS